MRLVKFFLEAKNIDKNINAWVREFPLQRCILQVAPYKEGVLVVYEKYGSQKDEWEAIKRSFERSQKR